MYKGLEIINKVDAPEAEINIIGDIGGGWFSEGVTVEAVVAQINELKGRKIKCTVASLGGDLSTALAIYDILSTHDAEVSTSVIGATASAGTVIAMAGNKRTMSNTAAFLIHQAQGWGEGNADEMMKQARQLAQFDGILATLYSDRTGKPSTEMYNLMKEERWLTASEALSYNLITEIAQAKNAVLNYTEYEELSNKLNVKPLKNKLSMTQEEIDALVAENEQLKADKLALEQKIAEYEKEKSDTEEQKMVTEDETIVEGACSEKKMTAEMKPHFLNLMKKDREGTRELIKNLPVIEPRRAIDIVNNKPDDIVKEGHAASKSGKLAKWAKENPEKYEIYNKYK